MKTSRKAHYLYTASLFFLIFLTTVCIAISAADVIIQALTDRTDSGLFDYRNLVVVGGSYLVLAIASLWFSCSRVLTVRGSLQDIPKLYIPIKEDDLPKKVFKKIQQGFDEAQRVRKAAEPLPEDISLIGWAKPGTPMFEGVDFKRAIARTPSIIEKAVMEIDREYARPTCVSIHQYIEFLIQQDLVDSHLGRVYLQGYERARFSAMPLTQEEYMDIMKHLAAILHHMDYRLDHHSYDQDTHRGPLSSSDDEDGNGGSIMHGSAGYGSSRRGSFTGSNSSVHTDLRRHRPLMDGGPTDDDIASLALSVATWSSTSHHRSTSSSI
ncbi:uncharacterized protein BYT42DRAFT_543771 [Radiomyces spectabilis]|uniref:uncharacterized protein n=1 Tax=Radiomyces spectabilis TaxID=64574 RepID=UPI00222060E4|nr:uncharacterized protein BYT42DRAFT_543771 [Radiomyces spectabilis]KAI8388477.1 hypothetical protein BYT42DRAFT_543771 [Radiomyces spectabilis]